MGKDKGKPIFGLEKISTEELLKFSRQEVGKLNSYIDELKYDIKNLKKEINQLRSENIQLRSLSRKEREKLKHDEYIILKNEEMLKLKSQLNKWRKKYDNLLLQSLSDKKNE